MHLWPSVRLRDSFKIAYLKKLELNLHLMKLDKKKRRQDPQASTSDDNNENDNQAKLLSSNSEDPSKGGGKFIAICREFLFIISCCYCCFGCGAGFLLLLASDYQSSNHPKINESKELRYFFVASFVRRRDMVLSVYRIFSIWKGTCFSTMQALWS